MSSTRRALAFSFLDRYAGLVTAIASSMVIARLLTPKEIGVFSVTMVLLSFVSTFRDFGAGQYLVQEKDLTTERIRATWTVQLGLGCLFALIGLAAAKPIAAFYREPRMVDLMLVLSLNFAISPFGSLTYAWLMREMRFDILAVMRFSSGLAGALVSVALAWRGHGPISLAFGSLAATVVNAALATHYRPASFPWLPGLRGLRRVVSFGGRISFMTIVNHVSTSSPELFLAKFHGLTAAGFFSRANGLAGMFHRLVMDATQGVALALFSRESRETGRIEISFLRATSFVTAVGWSFFLLLAFLAHPIVFVLYGPQWGASVEATHILAVNMMIGIMVAMSPTALMSIGAITASVYATLLSMAEYVVLVALGSWYGLMPLTAAMTLGTAVSAAIWLYHSQRQVGFTWASLATVLVGSAGVACGAALVPAAVYVWLGPHPADSWLALAVGVPGSCIMFVVAAFVVRHPVHDELSAGADRLCLLLSSRFRRAP